LGGALAGGDSGIPAGGAGGDDPLGLVGTLLERKYRVDARVAEGGFGVVYAGQHIGLAKPLAIKVLKCGPELSAAERAQMVAQFLEEARLVARLRHPAVVGVSDAGITVTERHPEGVPWIVMEWLDGETLARDLARRRARGEPGRTRDETMALLRPVIEAMAEAHDAGIAHRDLTPNNLMLVPGRRSPPVRVLDFGIAKVMHAEAAAPSGSTTTDSAVRAFCPAYAAPEQLTGRRTGPWTDVHALGLLFTEVLCGHRGPAVDEVDAQYRAALDPRRPTPATLGVDVGSWEAILARALALNPRDRYASAGELLAAFDGGRLAEPVHPVAAPEPGVDPEAPTVNASNADSSGRDPARAPAPRRWTRIAAPVAVVAALLLAGWMVLNAHRGRPAAASSAAMAARCTSNAACSTPGAPAICRPDVGCVALRSEDCEPLADARALDSDSTVWFGTMFPRTRPDAAFGRRETNAVELARRDFAQIMSGASAASLLERARPFGLIACDDAADSRRAAHHLVDVGVPAVIGFFKSAEAIELTTSVFLPRRILAIASLNTNPLVTSVPQPDGVPRLVWRTTYNSTSAASALSAWIRSDVEPSLRASGELGRRGMRVALLRPSDAAGDALGAAFLNTLRFNGKAAVDNADFREMTIEAEAPRTSPGYGRMLDELLRFAPDVILYAANVAIIEAVFAPLEARWPRGAHRPRYASIALIPPELLDFVGTSQERRRRFFGVTPVGSTTANARLVTHYNETFSDPVTRTISPNASYDAFYLLAYATYAIPRNQAVTGERLARAFGKLVPPGRPIEVGLAGIFDAYAALSRDASIDLIGATGSLDFDPSTGEYAFDQAILCVGLDEHGKADGIESGRVYSARSDALVGTMHCP
jgi:serine/threonine protein kinase/ABC-type branched-subunit amino acid transport system substrate-binding protein